MCVCVYVHVCLVQHTYIADILNILCVDVLTHNLAADAHVSTPALMGRWCTCEHTCTDGEVMHM